MGAVRFGTCIRGLESVCGNASGHKVRPAAGETCKCHVHKRLRVRRACVWGASCVAMAAGMEPDAGDPSRHGAAVGLALLQGGQSWFLHKVEVKSS